MSVRIKVKNFQSIADAEILVDRFTAVTGQNNSGKTATMRAVQGLFANASGDSFVRHGTHCFVVDMEFGDGTRVRWEKGPKLKPTYSIGGKTLHPGRGVPDEVSALGIQPITVGSTQIWPQIAPQFTGQVFLLDMPGSSIAEAVADVERVGRLTQALRLAESDKRTFNSELKVRRKDKDALEDQVQSFAGLDAVGGSVENAESLLEEARSIGADLSAAESFASRLSRASVEISSLVGVKEVLVPPVRMVEQAKVVKSDLVSTKSLQMQHAAASATVQHLQGVEGVCIPSNTQAIEARDMLRGAQAVANRHAQVSAILQKVRAAHEAVSSINISNPQDSLLKIRNMLSMCTRVKRESETQVATISSIQRKIDVCNADLEAAEREVAEILSVLKVCPLCKSPTDSHPHG